MSARLFCRLCGYPRFLLNSRRGRPERPARLFGLIPARAATPDYLEAKCLQCDALHEVTDPSLFIGTPYNTPISEYGSNTPRPPGSPTGAPR